MRGAPGEHRGSARRKAGSRGDALKGERKPATIKGHGLISFGEGPLHLVFNVVLDIPEGWA